MVGHRDIQETHKTCPNFDAGAWWARHNPLAQKNAMVMTEIAPIYRAPPEENQPAPAPETEALMGEEVAITAARQHHGYVEISLVTDGYQGWIKADSLCAIPENITGTIQAIRTACCIVTAEADVNLPSCQPVYGHKNICIINGRRLCKNISLWPGRRDKTGHLPRHMLASKQLNTRSDWPAYAEMFIGAPYKWGGAALPDWIVLPLSSYRWGQPAIASRAIAGHKEFMQTAAKADALAFQHFQRGDIIFWKGMSGYVWMSEIYFTPMPITGGSQLNL